MYKGLLKLGYTFFIIEILIGLIYGMALVPWSRLSFLLGDASLSIMLLILWNIGGAIFLWLGYKD